MLITFKRCDAGATLFPCFTLYNTFIMTVYIACTWTFAFSQSLHFFFFLLVFFSEYGKKKKNPVKNDGKAPDVFIVSNFRNMSTVQYPR